MPWFLQIPQQLRRPETQLMPLMVRARASAKGSTRTSARLRARFRARVTARGAGRPRVTATATATARMEKRREECTPMQSWTGQHVTTAGRTGATHPHPHPRQRSPGRRSRGGFLRPVGPRRPRRSQALASGGIRQRCPILGFTSH